MDTTLPSPPVVPNPPPRCALKIIGVGGAGGLMLKRLRDAGFSDAGFCAVDASGSCCDPATDIVLKRELFGRHGSHRSEPGRVELEAQGEALKPACENCDAVFIVAGLGGLAGSWLASSAARKARESGAAVHVFVTLPFECEGSVRFSRARQALERLAVHCDFVFVQPHQDFAALHTENTALMEAYDYSARRLESAMRHVSAALRAATLMGSSFADLCGMQHEHGAHVMFVAAGGEPGSTAGGLVEELIAHPKLDSGKVLAEAGTVAVSLVGGHDLKMADVNKVMQDLGKHWQNTPHQLSAGVCEGQGSLSALMLVANRADVTTGSRLASHSMDASAPTEAAEFNKHFLTDEPPKSQNRLGRTTAQDAQASATRGRATRQRTQQPKMRQAQLQLDIANKGRFEKSEPTIHKGEDMDVPTYIRRGVVLN